MSQDSPPRKRPEWLRGLAVSIWLPSATYQMLRKHTQFSRKEELRKQNATTAVCSLNSVTGVTPKLHQHDQTMLITVLQLD
jgi:hypothetical protein